MQQHNKTPMAARIMLIVGCPLILTVAAMCFFQDNTPAPSIPNPQLPAPPATAEKAEATGTPAAVAASEEQRGAYLNTSTATLHQITELQSALEIQKLMVALEEQNARLKELQEVAAQPPAPQIVALPPGASAPASPPAPASPAVISVQGIGGHILATVDTGAGLRTLKVGDDFNSGRVERISAAGVHVREGGRTRLMAVEE